MEHAILQKKTQGLREAGVLAKRYIEQGLLVPDHVITCLMLNRLEKIPRQSWLLDGFPRTLVQAEALNSTCDVDVVISLNIPFETLKERLSTRWVHPSSGRMYNMDFNPPRIHGIDDVTGEPLVQHEDDKPDVVAARLREYKGIAKPVIDLYKYLKFPMLTCAYRDFSLLLIGFTPSCNAFSMLVDSSGDFNNGERAGNTQGKSSTEAQLAAKGGPARREDCSTMDSSGASSPDMEANSGGGLLDIVKGGAGRLFSNLKDNLKDTLKDTSSKVMHSVASYTKGELDISYITSRIIVMSYPAEAVEIGYRNHIEDVRSFLDSRHMDHYTVFNLSQKLYRSAKFHNRVSECSWPSRQAPSLHNLFAVCKNMHNFLQQNPKNVCVIHCMDGRAPSGVLVCAMFCFCHLFNNPLPAIQLLNSKRPGSGLWPSHRRYIDYVCSMVSEKPTLPHCKALIIKSVTMSPVPSFNKQRTGCRPFCDILIGETKIFSTAQEYERMREHRVLEGKVMIPLGVSVHGDVVVSVFHMRSTIGGRLQAKQSNSRATALLKHHPLYWEGEGTGGRGSQVFGRSVVMGASGLRTGAEWGHPRTAAVLDQDLARPPYCRAPLMAPVFPPPAEASWRETSSLMCSGDV
ncbi:UNVERIFIED_CONTAM: hypothetical protein FKN15_064108 [Acipenser sinensis]